MKSKEEINKLREETRKLFEEKFGNIVFDEGPHKYYIDGKEYTPVSTIIGQYENEFDLELQSKRKSERLGITQDEVKQMWKYTNICATTMGTRAHEYGESLTNILSGHEELICKQNIPQYIKDEGWLIPTFPQEFAMKSFYDNLDKRIIPFGAEFKLSTKYINGAKPICGTADILFYYNATDEDKSGFVIGDWKGLDVNIPILTTNGWKTMGTVEVGDEVYDKNGEHCKVLHTSEIHNRKCYKITFNNKEEIISDNEHRWVITFTNGSNKYTEKIMTSEELYNYLKSFSDKIESYKIPKIRVAKPIKNDKKKLPIDPYVLGAWLGDGNKVDGKITNMNDWMWDEIRKRGYEIWNDVSQCGKGKAETRTILGLTHELRLLGLLKNKHIPEMYLTASEEQRLDLLRGLMDTDGYYNKARNRFVMCTTQDWQVEATALIVSTLGIKPTIIYSKGKCNNCKKKQVFDKVDIAFSCEINPFLHKHKEIIPPSNNIHKYRNIIKVEEVNTIPTRCIEVDSPTHTFLCGKNFLVTHNTNRELTKDYVRNNNIMMKYPFDNYYDEALSHYYLQFNIYQRMMESIGLNVIARRLIHVKKDGTYEVHQIPKIDDRLIDQVIYE